MNTPRVGRIAAAILVAAGALHSTVFAAQKALTPIRMTVDEEPIVVTLTQSLGNFEREGIKFVFVDLEKLTGEDYLMQEALMKGRIDASFHWFNHAIYGARHGFPIEGVMLFNDAPGMTVLVANRVKDQIHGVPDFKGRNVAEGAGYGTKSVITHFMARRAGLAPDAYTSVVKQKEGRTEAVIQGLKDGKVDLMTFEEPVVTQLMDTGLVSPLLDLNSRAATEKQLGAPFLAESLLMSSAYVKAHPETTQHLVNAFVRTMRFINSHTTDEVIAALPASYFKEGDRAATEKLLRKTISNLAKGDYAFPADGVRMVAEMNTQSDFDKSGEGQWRAGGDRSKVHPDKLYTNRFVDEAMKEIR
ncbi:MAG: ABC transporter substrate-binding protein [Pseudomonadota bacterium]|nr:ABC transporter substrate-binding protein [Pseudomonadota bacterium]